MKLALLSIASTLAAVNGEAQTLERFHSVFSQESSIGVDSGGSDMPNMNMVTKVTGSVAYDPAYSRMRVDFTGVSMEMPGGQMAPISIAGAGTNLLLYDIGKNFTWADSGDGTVTCTCDALTGAMPLLYVDPNAKLVGDATITVNKKSVDTKQYQDKSEVSMGDTSQKIEANYYIEPQSSGLAHLAQVAISISVGSGPGGVSLNDKFSFWDTKELTNKEADVNKFVPDPSCSCPSDSPPKIATVPATGGEAYPSKPTDPCDSPAEGCSCGEGGKLPDIEFCKDEVNYPISDKIFEETTDSFVQNVYDSNKQLIQAAGGDPSDECLASYKTFMCRFFFRKCAKDSVTSFPPLPDFSGQCDAKTSEFLSDSKETQGYKQVKDIPTEATLNPTVEQKDPSEGNMSAANSVRMSGLGLATTFLLAMLY